MMSSGIANTAQAWDDGVRSFVKASIQFSVPVKNTQVNKSTTNQAKKEKDPALPQNQVLGTGKTVALCCCG